jgi:hypothetical protein
LLGVAHERDLKRRIIRGGSSEEAACQVEALYWDSRPAFERWQRKR